MKLLFTSVIIILSLFIVILFLPYFFKIDYLKVDKTSLGFYIGQEFNLFHKTALYNKNRFKKIELGFSQVSDYSNLLKQYIFYDDWIIYFEDKAFVSLVFKNNKLVRISDEFLNVRTGETKESILSNFFKNNINEISSIELNSINLNYFNVLSTEDLTRSGLYLHHKGVFAKNYTFINFTNNKVSEIVRLRNLIKYVP